jgi:hypothetical protein
VNLLREAVLAELVDGVWHTTNQDRFHRILECGAILPEPEISEYGRWGGHSYVRSIGGVSLFDFRGFEAESYSAKYPASSWEYFVPCHRDWDSAVWIEIDHESLGSAFISGVELLAKWKAEGLVSPNHASDRSRSHRAAAMPSIQESLLSSKRTRRPARIGFEGRKIEGSPASSGDELGSKIWKTLGENVDGLLVVVSTFKMQRDSLTVIQKRELVQNFFGPVK